MQSKKTKELIKRTQTLSLATAMLVTSLNFPVISVRAEDGEQTTTEIEQVIDDDVDNTDQIVENQTEESKDQTEENKDQTTEEQTEENQTENKEQTEENQTEENKDQTTEEDQTEETEENEEEVSDEVLDDEATTLADGEITATIIIDANGGTFADGSSQKTFNVEAGTGQYYFNFSLAEVPSAPSGKNWTFKGWSESDSSEAHYSTDSTYSNFLSSGSTKTFYAAWGKSSQQTINRDYVFTDGAGHSETITKQETLTYDENNKLVSITYGDYLSTLSRDSDTALYRFDESIIRRYAAEASQQAVDGWTYTPTRDYYSDDTLNNKLTMGDIRNNISTIYVKCDQEQATVTVDASGGTFTNGASVNQIKITNKQINFADIELPKAPEGENWTFEYWAVQEKNSGVMQLYKTTDSITYTGNYTTIYAYWQKPIERTYILTDLVDSVSVDITDTLEFYKSPDNIVYSTIASKETLENSAQQKSDRYFGVRDDQNDYGVGYNKVKYKCFKEANLTNKIKYGDLLSNIQTIYVDCKVYVTLNAYDVFKEEISGTCQSHSFWTGKVNKTPNFDDYEITVPEGYSFVGWYVNPNKLVYWQELYDGDINHLDNYIEKVNNELILFDFDTPINGSKHDSGDKESYTINLFPQFQKIKSSDVTVTFKDYDGTELNTATTTTDKKLADIKPTEPTKDNHLFLGWSTDGTEANIVGDTTTFTSNTTLIAVYAEYNKVTYTLYNDGSTFPDGTTASKTISYETFIQGVNNRVREADVKYSDMTEVIPVREGYIFCGWTSTKNQNYGDVTTDTSNYLNGTVQQSTSHTGTGFWMNYNNSKNKTVMAVYDSVTVYPVWTKAVTFDACGGKFSNNQSTTYSTHDMLYDTYTDVGGNRQQTLWQNKCPVPTREGYQFVCWSNIKPISNTDFSNTYRLNFGQSGINAVIIDKNDWYAYVKNNSATAAKGTNDDGAEVYAIWVPTYTKVIYHIDDMELNGTLQDNGLDGVTDYIDDSDPNDIKIIQYVPWYTDLNYQYSFKSNGRPLNVQWYKSRNFNVTEDCIGNLIPKQEKDIDVYAKQSVDITFDLNYDGHKQTKTFDKNTNITPIEDPEREVRIYNEETGTDDVYYYIFKGWYTNAECSGSAVDFSNLKATKETTYYAKWVEPKINHTVTFVDDVDGSTIDTQTVERNKTVTKPTYTGGNSYFHQDLIFLGWSETGSRYNIFDFTTPITGNKTLHAVYADAITIEFIDSYDGQTVETKKIAKDSKVSEPSFRGNDPDRRFVGWSFIGTADDLFDFNTVISNSITLYSAYAEPLPKYTVTFKDSLGPEFEVIESKIVTENDRVEAPVFNHNHTNKVLIGWSETRNDTDNLFDFNTGITSDIVLFAVYRDSSTPVKQTFTVTFNTDGGSSVSDQTVEKGNKVVKPANPTKEGYTFDCWTVGLLEFNFNTAINQNITLTARWTRNADPSTPVVRHTVKFIDWDGTVLKTEVVEDGKDATAPTNPVRNGYTFTGWDKSLSNIKDDMEIKAQYTKNTDPTTPEPTKPEPTKPEPEPETPVEPEKPTPTEPTPTEPTQPKDEEEIIPIIEDEPESEEEPTDSEEEEQVEDNIIPEIVVNEVTPEDDPAPIYVGDNDSDKETNATALGKFVEAVKVIAVSVVISLAALSGLLGLLLLIILWMKRVKVLNDRNTDEYNEEKFEVVYRTSVKSEGSLISELQKQENRVWTITIPDEIINERVTDEFKVELKRLFCKRYNGEQLIIKLGESEDARQIGKTIDEKENIVEFTFTE